MLEQKFLDSEEDEDPIPTAMELALRTAMTSESDPKQVTRLKRNKEFRSSTQEEILRRTLEGRPNE